VKEIPWFWDKAQLQAAINTSGTWAELSRQTGTATNTLKNAADRLGVKRPEPLQSSPTPPIDAPQEVSREEILEQENHELKLRLGQFRKLEVYDARALQVLESAVEAAKVEYKRITMPVDSKLTTHTFVLQWSDDHAAEQVSFEATNGANEYNWAIMLARWQRMARAIRSFKKNKADPVDELVILGLGDKVTGDIHDELRETNELVISKAAVKLGYDMGEFIASELVPLFKKITYVSVVGNHGRLTPKPEYKSPSKNWDWVSAEVLKLRLGDYPQVSVHSPDSFETVINVCGKNILCFHGDGIQSSMVGVPWGGIIRRSSELYKLYAKRGILIDHFALGHWHEANVVSQRAIWVNGSVKGPDEYGIKRHGGGQPPMQLLHTFHPTRGLVSTDYLGLS
jgi:hypothetical protein